MRLAVATNSIIQKRSWNEKQALMHVSSRMCSLRWIHSYARSCCCCNNACVSCLHKNLYVCVCVCVCVWKERERERKREREREREWVCYVLHVLHRLFHTRCTGELYMWIITTKTNWTCEPLLILFRNIFPYLIPALLILHVWCVLNFSSCI
jgi:hypothetical protein